MSDVTNDLLYELLRRISADVGNIYGILHRNDERLARIENRLELSEPAE